MSAITDKSSLRFNGNIYVCSIYNPASWAQSSCDNCLCSSDYDTSWETKAIVSKRLRIHIDLVNI